MKIFEVCLPSDILFFPLFLPIILKRIGFIKLQEYREINMDLQCFLVTAFLI